MSEPVAVNYVMDEPYLREFHAQMVATRLPRWRAHRRAAFAFGLTALGMLGWGLTTSRLDVLILGALFGASALAMALRLRGRRERWFTYQRRLPTFGARITTTLDRGRLVQTSDRSTDVFAIPTGDVLETDRGWFVTYDIVHLGTEITDQSVSTKRASAYLPHAGFQPALTRDALAAQLAHTFTVTRCG